MKLHKSFVILICFLILTAFINLVSISQAGPPLPYIPIIKLSIKSPNGSYDNGIIPIIVDLRIFHGSTSISPESSFPNISCNYRLDDGQWKNIPLLGISSSKDFSFIADNRLIYEMHYNFSTKLYGLSDGFHIVEVTPNYTDYWLDPSGTSLVYFTSNSSSGITVVSVLLLPEIHSSFQNPPKENVKVNENVKISVNVTDPYFGVKNVTLFYSINNSSKWETQSMNINVATKLYEANISGQPAETNVRYKIVAYSNKEIYTTTNETDSQYTYLVIPEPFPLTLIITIIVIIIGVSTTLLIYFRKIKNNTKKNNN